MLCTNGLLKKKQYSTISAVHKSNLQILLENITNIPDEFQRNVFDLDDFANWKATQFRFFLHYAAPVFFHKFLKDDVYMHYMLFFVSCRILCCSELAVEKSDYARKLLTKFVELFPTYYGEDSQDINIHNIIHIVDDVEYTRLPLTELSAFIFEDCLGRIKEIVRGKTKPLQQVVLLLASPEARDLLEVKHPLHKRLRSKKELEIEFQKDSSQEIKKVIYKDMILDVTEANNTVQLKTGKIICIKKIGFIEEKIYFERIQFLKLENLFEYLCNSQDIGVYKLGPQSNQISKFELSEIKRKCVVLKADEMKVAITLLHSSGC